MCTVCRVFIDLHVHGCVHACARVCVCVLCSVAFGSSLQPINLNSLALFLSGEKPKEEGGRERGREREGEEWGEEEGREEREREVRGSRWWESKRERKRGEREV